jgi:hypothetical protein
MKSRKLEFAKLRRNGYVKEIFNSKELAEAFVAGIGSGTDARAAWDVLTFVPTKNSKRWTVFYKVDSVECNCEDEFNHVVF